MNFKNLVLNIVCVIISMTWLNLKILILQYFIGWKIKRKYFDLWHLVQSFDWCKTLLCSILCIMFDKINEISSDYDGTKYLVLFGLEKNDAIYGRIRYLIGLKCGVTYVFSYNFEKIKIESDDRLPLEETLTLHSVIILIRSVFNKDQYHYYCNIFVQRYSYQLPKK